MTIFFHEKVFFKSAILKYDRIKDQFYTGEYQGYAGVEAVPLSLIAHVFKKPISNFFPEHFFGNIELSEITPTEKELLVQVRRLTKGDQKKIIAQIKAVVNLNQSNTL